MSKSIIEFAIDSAPSGPEVAPTLTDSELLSVLYDSPVDVDDMDPCRGMAESTQEHLLWARRVERAVNARAVRVERERVRGVIAAAVDSIYSTVQSYCQEQVTDSYQCQSCLEVSYQTRWDIEHAPDCAWGALVAESEKEIGL